MNTELGMWSIAGHQVELSHADNQITANIRNSQGVVRIDPQSVYGGINGRTPHQVLIQKINAVAHDLISIFVYPQEHSSEVWVFEATQTAGWEIYSAKILLKQEPPDFPKALSHLKTARKLQSKKGDATEIKHTIIQVKRQCLILKWTILSRQYLPESDASVFNETLERYEDNILESFQELLEVEKQFSPHHHLMSALVHEEKREYLAAMEAYLALSEDNPNDLACFNKAYSCLEKASDEDASLKDRIDSVRITFEKQLRSLETTSKPPTCFICFNVEENDVGQWLEETLVPDMDCAGIKPIFCLPELSHGQDLDNFHELARQSDKVIVVCTSTLKTKFEERKKAPTGVAQEISMIRRRYRDPNKTDTIFPIFPKGMRDSIPTAYFESIFGTKFSPFKEGSFEMNYFSNAFDLICALKGISRKKSRKVRKRFQNEVKTILRGEINQEEVQSWRASKETRLQALRASIIQRVSDYTQVVNLPPPPAHFTGREDELTALHAACQQKSRVAIAGLGGVGKTALALKYADQFKLDYQFVHFMLASTEQLAIEGLLRLADDLHLPKSDKPEERLSWLKVTLERLKNDYLLIFDGMDQKEIFDAIEQYLPANGRCLLLTTRMPQDAQLLGFELIELHPLTLEDAVKYLLTATRSQDLAAATTLAQKLGRLPLALTHAARYISNNGISILKYSELFEQYELKLFEKERLKLKPHEQTILTTWQISIDAIKEKDNGALAKEVLELFAFLGQAPIPLFLVEKWCKTCHPEISELDLGNALGHLVDYSMINSPQPDTYSVHLLVQKVERHQMLLERQKATFQSALMTLSTIFEQFNEDKPDTWTQSKNCIPHAVVLVEEHLMEHLDLEKQSQILSRLGRICFVFRDSNKALEFHRKILKIKLQLHGKNHSDVGSSYNNIGLDHQALGDNDHALKFYRKALKIMLQEEGNLSHVTSCYNNISEVYQDLGNNKKAMKYQRKALKIKLKLYGEHHPEVTTNYNNIGSLYEKCGNNSKALKFLQIALEIRLEVFGENHPDVATSYNNIGMIYQNLGNNEKALEFLQKALKRQVQIYGENHPLTTTSSNNIGMAYQNLGNTEKALEFYQKALKGSLQVFKENHPSIATTYNNIGTIYQKLDDNNKALEFHQKALKIRLQVLEESHPDIAQSYCNIGSTYQELGDNNKALGYLQKALNMWLQAFGENHPHVATSYNNIAEVYQELGDKGKALEFYQKTLKILLRVIGENHPHVVACYRKIGMIYHELGDNAKALEFYQKNLKASCQIYGENNLNVAASYYNIGVIYQYLRDNAKALESHQKALSIWRSSYPDTHPKIIACLYSIKQITG